MKPAIPKKSLLHLWWDGIGLSYCVAMFILALATTPSTFDYIFWPILTGLWVFFLLMDLDTLQNRMITHNRQQVIDAIHMYDQKLLFEAQMAEEKEKLEKLKKAENNLLPTTVTEGFEIIP